MSDDTNSDEGLGLAMLFAACDAAFRVSEGETPDGTEFLIENTKSRHFAPNDPIRFFVKRTLNLNREET